MELNDNEFDAAFRKKVFNAEPRFEEAAWNKMEQKLKRRDRLVFFRKAGVLCLLLLLAFGGYYMGFNEGLIKSGPTIVKQGKLTTPQGKPKSAPAIIAQTQLVPKAGPADRPVTAVNPFYRSANVVKQEKTVLHIKDQFEPIISSRTDLPVAVGDSLRVKTMTTDVAALPVAALKPDSTVIALTGADVEPASVSSIVKKKKNKGRNPWPVSLSFSIGPEFNSSASLIGGKGGFSTGIGVSIGVAKRLKLQTGVKYSTKDYGTDGYSYAFKNENIKSMVSRVEASCEVLEIPLQASFTLMEDHYRSIDLNAGMSSYFMLKEDYTFKYTKESGYKDRFQEFRNQNQHYFGVIDLSATYYIKLKKEKFRLGVEPYVKIPVTGVGEGNVNLKSSGVALKLRYDLGKKNR